MTQRDAVQRGIAALKAGDPVIWVHGRPYADPGAEPDGPPGGDNSAEHQALLAAAREKHDMRQAWEDGFKAAMEAQPIGANPWMHRAAIIHVAALDWRSGWRAAQAQLDQEPQLDLFGGAA